MQQDINQLLCRQISINYYKPKYQSITINQNMHCAINNSPGENGYRHFEQNRTRTKPLFHILYFQFQTRSKYLECSNQSFPVHPIHIYNQFKPNVIFSMHSSDGIHSFLHKQSFFRDYLALRQ